MKACQHCLTQTDMKFCSERCRKGIGPKFPIPGLTIVQIIANEDAERAKYKAIEMDRMANRDKLKAEKEEEAAFKDRNERMEKVIYYHLNPSEKPAYQPCIGFRGKCEMKALITAPKTMCGDCESLFLKSDDNPWNWRDLTPDS